MADPRLALATTLLIVLSGCASPQGGEGAETITEDFETGIRNWEQAADVPEDPNRPGENVSWSIVSSRQQAHGGDYSVDYTLGGGQDDGTIWLERPLSVEPGRAYRANVSAMAWSEDESDNTLAHLVLYLGPEPPTAEEDFPPPGENTTDDPEAPRGGLREALNQRAGWHEYEFGWNVPALSDGELWAAVGISVVWETEVTYFVDDLEIELEPVDEET